MAFSNYADRSVVLVIHKSVEKVRGITDFLRDLNRFFVVPP